jgi:hypothetical protein
MVVYHQDIEKAEHGTRKSVQVDLGVPQVWMTAWSGHCWHECMIGGRQVEDA